jgi:hypothetical protein
MVQGSSLLPVALRVGGACRTDAFATELVPPSIIALVHRPHASPVSPPKPAADSRSALPSLMLGRSAVIEPSLWKLQDLVEKTTGSNLKTPCRLVENCESCFL